jgi:hypothetical protein
MESWCWSKIYDHIGLMKKDLKTPSWGHAEDEQSRMGGC